MNTRKWIGIFTLANLIVAVLLAFVLLEVISLAGIASDIEDGPVYLLLAIGFVLSIATLIAARHSPSRVAKYIAVVVNGGALGFNLLIAFGLANLYWGTTKVRFLIPDGYRGDVYILYGIPGGEAIDRTRREITYSIPEDGVLRESGKMITGWTRNEYYYVARSGKLDRIPNLWLSTIHPSPENSGNDKDVGVFFPRVGKSEDYSTGCSIEFEQFYVGTKAHLLTKYKPRELSDLTQRPGNCTSLKR